MGCMGCKTPRETKQRTVTLALTRDQRVPLPPISDPRFDLDQTRSTVICTIQGDDVNSFQLYTGICLYLVLTFAHLRLLKYTREDHP